jgi:putative transposase
VNDASASPKGYRFPKLVISHAVYLYHRLPISYRDVQELLFKRGIRRQSRNTQSVVRALRA